MSALVDLVPTTTLTTLSFVQSAADVVDVSGYSEVAVLLQVVDINVNRRTTTVSLDTAVENRDGQWVAIGDLESFSAAPALPYTSVKYLQGTASKGAWCGFARYLRIRVSQFAGASVTFSVAAMLKP